MPKNKPRAEYVEVDEDFEAQRLDNFLLNRLKGVPRSHVYRLVRSGQVRVNSGRVGPSYRLQAGDRVRIPPVRDAGHRASLPKREGLDWLAQRILLEDSRLIVLDKPAGMAVHGGGSASFGCVEALRSLRPGQTLELVHRLDRGTSGCLLIARRRSALRNLHRLMRGGMVTKRYVALVAGAWPDAVSEIDAPLAVRHAAAEARVRVSPDGKPSLTRFSVLERFADTGRGASIESTLVEAVIDTGRTHQIRVHAAHAGHPVAGDERYGDAQFDVRMSETGLRRMFLHARSIAFEWPEGGERFEIEAPVPDELEQVLERLRLD